MTLISPSLLVLTSVHAGAGSFSFDQLKQRASDRLHVQPLKLAADNLSIPARMLSVDVDRPSVLNNLGSPSICVVHKINHHDDSRLDGFAMAVLASVTRLKLTGTKIVLSYCDNLASLDDSRGLLYRDLFRLADRVVFPSDSMRKLVTKWLLPDTKTYLIEDPWSLRLQPYPAYSSHKPFRITWFGDVLNVKYLLEQLPSLMKSCSSPISYELHIVTKDKAFPLIQKLFNSIERSSRGSWKLFLHQWISSQHPSQLENLLSSSHVVWIPSDPNDPLKAGVSHNRLVDSVRSGCIPLASKMSSYLELSRVSILIDSYVHVLDNIVSHYDRLSAKHTSLREEQLSRFSPELNLQKWTELLNELVSGNS